MPLSGVHVLLTYTCTSECDHCFLYCSPRAEGTFTMGRLRQLLEQARAMGTVTEVYFEGGEPFLYYPILVAGVAAARELGFHAGLVSNAYWATTVEDARLWLHPLVDAGLGELSVSDDALHHGEADESPAARAARAAEQLGLPSSSICIERPELSDPDGVPGAPVIGGGTLLKGRAADRLTEGLPTRPAAHYRSCPHEELKDPKRVHVDPMGYVHVCQGVVLGNVWETPLRIILRDYDPAAHPICGPLIRGGPRALAEEHGLRLEGEFVDECHHCFASRRLLLERFPESLAPRQVYGFDAAE